ncbi:acyl-CoA carboxylase epsilon subunit [Amycolatopsis sp. cmx-8-4]|uniref:acyl-CoA carboxylase epsilon subunit n=1 Tax=Amycolatopsis sp. cmx-8-4 TaxID=2790947 RepID=UPI003979292F
MTPPVVVTRGAPDDAELAALVAVLTALRREPPPPPVRAAVPWGPDDRAYRPPGMWSSGRAPRRPVSRR